MLTKQQKREFAWMRKKFQMSKSGKQGFYQLSCPYCKNEKGRSGVYVPAISRYYCFQSAGACIYSKQVRRKGTWIVEFIQRWGRYTSSSKAYQEISNVRPSSENILALESIYRPRKEIVLPDQARPITEGNDMYGKLVRLYLKNRGYNVSYVWNTFRLMYIGRPGKDKDLTGYLVIPFFDAYGNLIYYQLRAFVEGLPRWMNPDQDQFNVGKSELLFNEAALIKNKELDLSEGATDTMTLLGGGILGLYLSEKVLYKVAHCNADVIYVVLDSGAWLDSLMHAYEIQSYTETPVYAVPMFDGNDPNKIGRSAYLRHRDKEAILINEMTFYEELSRVERIMQPNGHTLTFRSKHEQLLW